MNNCIKIEKIEKDEKSSPRCTSLIKKLRKPSLNKEGYTKRQKAYTHNEPISCRPNPKVCKLTAN